MRTAAEVDQGTTSVDGGRGAIRDLVLDVMLLVAVVLENAGRSGLHYVARQTTTTHGEHLEQRLFRQREALERLLLLDGDLGNIFEVGIVLGGHGPAQARRDGQILPNGASHAFLTGCPSIASRRRSRPPPAAAHTPGSTRQSASRSSRRERAQTSARRPGAPRSCCRASQSRGGRASMIPRAGGGDPKVRRRPTEIKSQDWANDRIRRPHL